MRHNQTSTMDKIALGIILYGIIIRVTQYLYNRSLWFDEALISLNIIEKSFFKLFGVLDYNQGAPIGFLLTLKTLVTIFGNHEYVLRFFPLICSIGSLIIFYKLLKELFEKKTMLFILSIFSLLNPFVYYASEVKQYSSDVFFTLCLFLCAVKIFKKGFNETNLYTLGILGAISIWFSFPTIFVLISIAFTLVFCKTDMKKENFTFLCHIFLWWILSLILLYVLNLRNLNKNVIYFFGENNFLHFPLSVEWLKSRYIDVINMMQYNIWNFPSILIFAGIVWALIHKRYLFFLLASPALLALIASAYHLYPYVHRFLLFLIPSYLIFMGIGFETLFYRIRKNTFIISLVLLALIYSQYENSFKRVFEPFKVQEIKPILKYIKNRRKENDIIYVYHSAQYPLKFYADKYNFINDFEPFKSEYETPKDAKLKYEKEGYPTLVIGISSNREKEKYLEQINELKGNKRVWFLFSHIWNKEEEYIRKHLDRIGKRMLQKIEFGNSGNCSAYLYDLS